MAGYPETEMVRAPGIRLDLSRGGKPDAFNLLLQTVPSVQRHFVTNINLGNEKNHTVNFSYEVEKIRISYFQKLVKIATAGSGLPSVK